jgi:hypothetical protein
MPLAFRFHRGRSISLSLSKPQVHTTLHHLILLHRPQKLLDIFLLFLSDLQISLLSSAGLHLEVFFWISSCLLPFLGLDVLVDADDKMV